MFGKIASVVAMLALLLSVAPTGADPKQPGCCATKTRCCAEAKRCCQTRAACCDMKDCCGPKPAPKAAAACPVTGLARRQCCASKASQQPPCCAKGCDTAGRLLR
jgi:hypothetical protein